MMFFSVSFYLYFNRLHLVECGDVCDPEKSDTETKHHFCNYFLIIPSTGLGEREVLKCEMRLQTEHSGS